MTAHRREGSLQAFFFSPSTSGPAGPAGPALASGAEPEVAKTGQAEQPSGGKRRVGRVRTPIRSQSSSKVISFSSESLESPLAKSWRSIHISWLPTVKKTWSNFCLKAERVRSTTATLCATSPATMTDVPFISGRDCTQSMLALKSVCTSDTANRR
eukprot:CAMPEP_0172630256 /NCGR_PEP_ID=MMETSP1068-20121228/172719_1 /TAXON_ID=35684 /ORGANISM="Pseudopedinella elastica, Strain CCMP716" /LENGTH=155 /DNA_ID=CAMNT_0013441049 /DNA_START=42 /DNA_END=505 /DNA_ORIENTATION=+